MPRRHRPLGLLVVAVLALLLAGCSSAGTDTRPGPPRRRRDRRPRPPADPTVSAGPLLTALDVCSLATPAQVRRAAGQAGEPDQPPAHHAPRVRRPRRPVRVRRLVRLLHVRGQRRPRTGHPRGPRPGCPASRSTGSGTRHGPRTRPGSPRCRSCAGRTLVQVLAVQAERPRPRGCQDVTAVAAADRPPGADRPAGDRRPDRGRLLPVWTRQAVDGVLGAPAGVSRTLEYKDRSAMCTFATGRPGPAHGHRRRLQQRPGRAVLPVAEEVPRQPAGAGHRRRHRVHDPRHRLRGRRGRAGRLGGRGLPARDRRPASRCRSPPSSPRCSPARRR